MNSSPKEEEEEEEKKLDGLLATDEAGAGEGRY